MVKIVTVVGGEAKLRIKTDALCFEDDPLVAVRKPLSMVPRSDRPYLAKNGLFADGKMRRYCQRIAQHITALVCILGFLAILGLAGWIEGM